MQNEIEKKLFASSLKMLARKPYHSAEIKKKLTEKFPEVGAEVLENTLEKLKRLQLINDTDYIRSYILNGSRTKPSGKIMIRNTLRQKGISEDEISGNSEYAVIDECLLASKALSQKVKTIQIRAQRKNSTMNETEQNYKVKEKCYRFLASRGFPHSVIIQVVNEYIPKS